MFLSLEGGSMPMNCMILAGNSKKMIQEARRSVPSGFFLAEISFSMPIFKVVSPTCQFLLERTVLDFGMFWVVSRFSAWLLSMPKDLCLTNPLFEAGPELLAMCLGWSFGWMEFIGLMITNKNRVNPTCQSGEMCLYIRQSFRSFFIGRNEVFTDFDEHLNCCVSSFYLGVKKRDVSQEYGYIPPNRIFNWHVKWQTSSCSQHVPPASRPMCT